MRKTSVLETPELYFTAKSSVHKAASGWEQAVCSAAARLNEGWVLPETKCDAQVAEELAAFLCAYGV